MYRFVPIVLAVALAACASHSKSPAEEDAEATAAANAAAAEDAAKCQALGLQPNTPKYEQCLTKLADQRAQAEARDRGALAGRLLGRPPGN